MEPGTSVPNNHKTLVWLGALVLITIAGAIIPASWFNVEDKNQTLDLTSVDTINVTPKNKETNQTLTWKQLAESALSDQPEVLEQLKSEPIDTEVIAQLNDEENLTASFSKNLYVASAYLKENNITDESAQQEVINQLVAQEASKIVPTTYSYKDINVAKAESRDSIRFYGNTVASIIKDIITEKTITDDFGGFEDFLNTKNPESLQSLTNDSERVGAIVRKLLDISVPPSASIYHIIMLNQIGAYRDMLYNLSMAETDSLRANIAFQKYTDTLVETLSIYKNISKYFDIKNIVFSSKESGYVFTIGYTPK